MVTTTSRRLAKIFQRSPCCGESDGNLGNILPICRLRNSAKLRTPSERDFATLTVSACGLSLTDLAVSEFRLRIRSTQARDVSAWPDASRPILPVAVGELDAFCG